MGGTLADLESVGAVNPSDYSKAVLVPAVAGVFDDTHVRQLDPLLLRFALQHYRHGVIFWQVLERTREFAVHDGPMIPVVHHKGAVASDIAPDGCSLVKG